MKLSQLHKIYLANFLTGLVFWYGIEKLFMKSIGLDAASIGIIVAIGIVTNLLLDIPSGVITDKWSRKVMLFVSATELDLSSLILGLSDDLFTYTIGFIVYSIYIVGVSGTFQAISYDSLHEEGRSADYSKLWGRAYGLFLIGAVVGSGTAWLTYYLNKKWFRKTKQLTKSELK